MTRCANKDCRHKLPKGALPMVCNSVCRDMAIAQAIAKKRAADKRAAARAKNLVEREAKEQRKQFRLKRQEYYNNDYAHQFDLTKKAAQKLANTLDAGLECISCGCGRSVQFCGGHFRTVGAHRELALDLRNIHGQCNRNCNMALSGNIGGTKRTRGFRAGLLARYGQALVDFLETAHPAERLTCEKLIAIRAEYAAETRRLEKGLPPSRDWRALPERLSGIQQGSVAA